MKRSGFKKKPGAKGLERTEFKRKPDAKGLERGGGPSPNPERVREWIQKSRKTSHENRRTPTPREVVEAARVRSRSRCVVCGTKEQSTDWPHHPHHVFPVNGPLHSWPELWDEPANIILLCPGCHDNHERAHKRVPRAKLPPETIALAVGHVDRQIYLEDTYPAV